MTPLGISISAGLNAPQTTGGVVNAAPVVEITSPSAAAVFDPGESISFTCTAEDAEDGSLTGADVVWTSDVDGQIGTGVSFSKDDLTPGPHTITCTATDSGAKTGNDQVAIRVNVLPVAEITSPSASAVFDEGENISLEGTGTDDEDGSLSGSALEWESDVDGALGTGSPLVKNDLTAGSHTITLTVTDGDGGEDTDTVAIRVNALPVAAITAPAGSSQHQQGGSNISFEGTGTDDEDGSLTGAALAWSSDVDGALGTGSPLSIDPDTLTIGNHTITLTVTDSDGGQDTDTVAIEVTAAGAWAPDDEAGLLLWVEREREIYTDSAGTDPADTATDVVGNWGEGDNVIQATSTKKPVLVDIDGVLVPNFDGTDDNLTESNPTRFNGLTALHIIARVRLDALAANDNTLLSRWVHQTATQFAWDLGAAANDEMRAYIAESTASSGSTHGISTDANLAIDTDYTLEFRFDGAGVGNAARLKLFRDGTQLGMTFNGTIPAALTTVTADLSLGSFLGTLARNLDGKVRGLVAYNNVLAGQALTDARAYMDAL